MKDAIERFAREVSSWKVLVVGESIQDEFLPVTYEGHSMKSNCPVLRLEGEPIVQDGGAGAIANHLRDFVQQVDLVTNAPGTIVKTRYFDKFDIKKHVEINRFARFEAHEARFDPAAYDVVIVADFGHGFCDHLSAGSGYCFMAQTNSNNFGFNRISKWKDYRKKMVALDLREASLQMNRRFTAMGDKELLELYDYELNTEILFVTLGAKGSVFTNGKQIVRQPVFVNEHIVDTIGAGDTFFAFASLVSHLPNPEPFLFIPALAANLSTTWLCNEKSVTLQTLQDHANKFLSAGIQ
jgi:bifunctional ADP-heptose synthase (sugar kinase/adenylyltransferase)